MDNTLFLLLSGHALADYPLQGDFLARGKNFRAPLPGVPWYQCLVAHALIHGGMVVLTTRSVTLGISETILHCWIDHAKCYGVFGEGHRAFNIDQGLHVACKVMWAVAAFHGV